MISVKVYSAEKGGVKTDLWNEDGGWYYLQDWQVVLFALFP